MADEKGSVVLAFLPLRLSRFISAFSMGTIGNQTRSRGLVDTPVCRQESHNRGPVWVQNLTPVARIPMWGKRSLTARCSGSRKLLVPRSARDLWWRRAGSGTLWLRCTMVICSGKWLWMPVVVPSYTRPTNGHGLSCLACVP